MKVPPWSSADVKVDHDSTQEPARHNTSRLDRTEALKQRAGGAQCLRVTRPSSPSTSPWTTRTAGRGAMGLRQQAAGNRKYRQQKVQLEAAARSRWITEKSGCWVGAHGLERRSCGWVAAQQWRQSDRAAAGRCTACGEHSLIKE